MRLSTATREIVQSAEGEIETDYIDSNVLEDSDDKIKRDNKVRGDVSDDLVSNYFGGNIEKLSYICFWVFCLRMSNSQSICQLYNFLNTESWSVGGNMSIAPCN